MGYVGFKKMLFVLEPDEAGWPPVRIEGVWVKSVEGEADVCELDSIPFYAVGAVGDRFRAVVVDGQLYAAELLVESGHGTVRVIGPDEKLSRLREVVIGLGCECERAEFMIAIDVPPSVDWAKVQRELVSAARESDLDYEEAVLPRREPPAK